jgi:predicted transcriptional regulator
MTDPQPRQKEQIVPRPPVDMDKVRAELDIRAQHIDEKIKRLEKAMLVSHETLRLEFKV